MTLADLATKHRCDKGPLDHNYVKWYEPLINMLGPLAALSVLEIGVAEGKSLRTWAEYLPNSKIVGIDNNDRARGVANNRIAVEIGSQGHPAFLQGVAKQYGPFDLVIDDGCHEAGMSHISFDTLWPHVKPGGAYCIEDVHAMYWNQAGQKLRDLVWSLVDSVNMFGRNGYGEPKNDPAFVPTDADAMGMAIEAVSFYKSLIIVRFRKRPCS